MPTYDLLYDPTRPCDHHELPRIEDFRFTSPSAVVEWARRDRTIPWKNWPDVWHLDHTGAFRCYYKGYTGESVHDWSRDANSLRRSRELGLASSDGCASNWLILETRPGWLPLEVEPNEADVAAFLEVRRTMAQVGVNLVDDVIFDETNRWWSLHEFLAPGEPYSLSRP